MGYAHVVRIDLLVVFTFIDEPIDGEGELVDGAKGNLTGL